MKFYTWTLAIYSVIATVLIIMLAMQNRELKQGAGAPGAPQTVNYDERVEIPIGDSPVLGEADAPVTITVFSEFECPFCARANEVVTELMKAHPGKIRLVYKSYPLDRHVNARPAAAAALAAGAQGKFWEMHDLLYLLQDGLNEEEYMSIAASLELDMERFQEEMALARWEDRINADWALGNDIGVNATPTFFVNGVRLPTYSFLEEAITHFLEGGGS